jgi:hypothetical protein
MAQLRLMLVALAACTASNAAPSGSGSGVPVPPGVTPPFAPPVGSSITPPAGWMSPPPLASAAPAQIDGARAEAWGEPAMGCYAATLTFAQRGAATAMVDEVKKTLSVHDVIAPTTASGVLAFGFDKAAYKGRVRATLDGKTVHALACFWNEREPSACEAACTALIGSQT